MKIPKARAFLLIPVSILMLTLPIRAHHSILPFDLSHPTEIQGSVVSFEWRNPHVRIEISTMKEREPVVWAIEADSPRSLEGLGWSKSTLVAGQKISVVGAPARDGSLSMLCGSIVLDGGSKLPCLPQAQR